MLDTARLNAALGGRYAILKEIGAGGMATVYLARDVKHDREVALKVLRPELSAVLGADRFLREVRINARLDHPHLLTLIDSGADDGFLWYVLPYVRGESLRAKLDHETQLGLNEALEITRQVGAALDYAHRQGVIHRDIKPENILVFEGQAMLTDFGIALAVTEAAGDRLTETGLSLGTPQYMSPEQATGDRHLSARSDVYSLGAVLYEMLAGEPPHSGATARAIIAKLLTERPTPLRVLRRSVPEEIESAVMKALGPVPADRFATAAEFAAACTLRPPIAVRSADRSHRRWADSLGVALRQTMARRPRLTLSAAAAALATILFMANVGGLRTRFLSDASRPQIKSLAVLPLENLSGDAEQDYFAAGMHEALIVDLGKLSGLRRVSARPSVLRYQKIDKPLRQIADALGVDALVTGTVLRSGNRVRITAHLIDPATEQPLWADSYEREVRDVLALQNEIVAAIARQVRLQLSPRERAGLARARQVNPEAYEAYLKGKFQLNKFTPEGFAKGLALLNQAIAIDPAEPLAYAGLAWGYTLTEIFSPTSSPDDISRAKAAALKAVELDESLAEAHVALGDVKGMKEWDYAGAAQSYRRALELNPNLPEAHIHYAQYLTIFGSQAEAITEWKRGIELDPLSPLYTAWLGGAYWEFGRFDEAISESQKAMELQPDFPVALFVLGLAHLDKGQFQEAIAAHEKALALYPHQNFSWTLARTYAITGRTADARRILARLKSGGPLGDAVHPWFIAAAYVAVGENEEALKWLERAYEARIFFLANLARERAAGFDIRPLRTHPRFQALLRRLNLPE